MFAFVLRTVPVPMELSFATLALTRGSRQLDLKPWREELPPATLAGSRDD